MTDDQMEDTTAAAPDYQQIGRFIYGTARLEMALSVLAGVNGPAADAADIAANVTLAEAMFRQLPAAEGDKIAFTALMHVLATFAGQRDAIFDAIAEMPAEELAARNDSLAAATEEVRRLAAIAQALSTGA